MAHRTELHPDVIAQIMRRRGRLHAKEILVGAKTALAVIDLQTGFMQPGMPGEVPMARAIVPTVNRLATALRNAGGLVAWVTIAFPPRIFDEWTSLFGNGDASAGVRRVSEPLIEGAPGTHLWPELEPAPGDLHVTKNRFSAFLPGSSDIEAQLRARGIDTVLIAGTQTNVCCDASARDAMMRNFSVVMVADANAAPSDALHNATLTSLIAAFADVMTADEAIAALAAGTR